MDKTLYVFSEFTDELDGQNYIPKKVLPLNGYPYCALQVGEEILIGCDFELTIVDFTSLMIVGKLKCEHRVTNMYSLNSNTASDHLLVAAFGNWTLEFNVFNLKTR